MIPILGLGSEAPHSGPHPFGSKPPDFSSPSQSSALERAVSPCGSLSLRQGNTDLSSYISHPRSRSGTQGGRAGSPALF